MFRLMTVTLATVICSAGVAKTPAIKKDAPSVTRAVVDTKSSVINWTGTKAFVGDSHTGTVNISSGTLFVDNDKITGGDLTIDMNSIKCTDVTDPSMNGKLVGHLKSEDFFATEKNKDAKFVIKEVKNTAEGQQEFIGDVTIRGVTQPMKIKAKVSKEAGVWTAIGKTDFDRTKFGVKYNSKDFFPDLIKSGKDKVIKNEIDLTFTIKAS